MRPINKGTWPLTPIQQLRANFNDWTRAIPHLTLGTGEYCHFCEMRVTNQIAIEHIKPKEHFPRLESNWSNFLLICTSCNSRKGQSIPLSPYKKHYFWPHLNNTLKVFEYPIENQPGLVIPNGNIGTDNIRRAQNTIDLYKLSDISTTAGTSDKRFEKRIEAIRFAIDRRVEYRSHQTAIAAIVDNAVSTGFFSVWLRIFDDIPQVRTALILRQEFHLPATCIDHNLAFINRTNSDI